MVAPFAALEQRALSVGYGRLANAEVVRGAGQPGFNAILDVGTADAFGEIRAGENILRMQAQPVPVFESEVLQINGVAYRVTSPAEEVTPGLEFSVQLVKL